MCGVENSDSPCLASGHNLNLIYEELADIWRQGIAVEDNNDPAPEKIPVPIKITLTKLEEDNSWRSE